MRREAALSSTRIPLVLCGFADVAGGLIGVGGLRVLAMELGRRFAEASGHFEQIDACYAINDRGGELQQPLRLGPIELWCNPLLFSITRRIYDRRTT